MPDLPVSVVSPEQVPSDRVPRQLFHSVYLADRMNGQEAFRRFAQQLQRASSGGSGGGPRFPSGKGFTAGGGLLVALIGGGLALNASLFNGKCYF